MINAAVKYELSERNGKREKERRRERERARDTKRAKQYIIRILKLYVCIRLEAW
jgi:hypothetical protein